MHRLGLAALLCVILGGCASPAINRHTVPRWGVHELTLASGRDYANPLWDIDVQAQLTSPSGKARTVGAFWDGQRTWRVRISPDEIGWWKWKIVTRGSEDAGLSGATGQFACVATQDPVDPMLAHGPLRVSDDRSHLCHADGTPFYWLADTAWNGALRSSAGDWDTYLDTRKRQGFSVIQFVTTQWRGGDKVLDEPIFIGRQHIGLNAQALRRLDERIQAIVSRGLVPAPVMLWALQPGDPGQYLPEEDAIRLARHMVARWGAYNVAWMLNGDGRYNENPERWKRLGRAVFADRHDQLVTQHPSGQHWIADTFKDEPWYDFIGYQSGHGSSDSNLKWLVTGPVAAAGKASPVRPLINLEPNYEGHPSYQSRSRFTDREVRRAAYWSQLVTPTAGVTYGNNEIWVWNPRGAAAAENHKNIGVVDVWRKGLQTPGIDSMTLMRRFFESGPWHRLRPAPERVIDNPGLKDPGRFIAAATGGSWTVVYLPVGGAVTLDTAALPKPLTARWFDPRTGAWSEAGPIATPRATLRVPGAQDWLLSLQGR